MGLDIILCLMILAAAVRGWLCGFVIQTIRLVGLVGSIYAAAPVRDFAKPHIDGYFTSIRPELLVRILWWTAAVATYVVSVGLASLAVKMKRRRPFGEIEPNRTDQFAGFLMGGIKGALVAAFLVAGLQKYVAPRVKDLDWAHDQATSSYALKWDGEYQPAKRVWKSIPVQHFVAEIKRMGVSSGTVEEKSPASNLDPEPVQAAKAETPPRLQIEERELPPIPSIDPSSADFKHDFDRVFELLMPGQN